MTKRIVDLEMNFGSKVSEFFFYSLKIPCIHSRCIDDSLGGSLLLSTRK